MRSIPRRLAAVILALELVLLAAHPLLHAAKARGEADRGAAAGFLSGPVEGAAAEDCVLCRVRRDDLPLASASIVLEVGSAAHGEPGLADLTSGGDDRHSTSQARAPPSLL
jgi:hypothetical protein